MGERVSINLRCELHGHQEDVRSVCTGDIGVITSSRDSTVKIWAEESPIAYGLLATLTGHTKYVGAVAYAPPGRLADCPNGAVVSGSFDATVMVWDIGAPDGPVRTLKGHQYQVTALAVLPNGDIASASVDKTIRTWHGGKQVKQLDGHEGPVLCLTVTDDGELISGSGDTTLRRWRSNGSCAAVYKGHTDTVRGVCMLPGIGFISGSHDLSLRVWSLPDGAVQSELLGHTAIIYSVAATPAGLIASGSEDNTVRLWSAATASCLQVIEHPGCVWAVTFTPQGDLVSGCSDAVARVWSTDPSRQADAEATASYHKLLEDRKAATAAASTQEAAAAQTNGATAMDVDGSTAAAAAGLPPGVKVAKSYELAQPGAKDGETKIVREQDGSIAAYSWDAGKCVWEKIGTVVDAPEPGVITSDRKWYMGREWDYVFDVEMDSGLKLKLALDAGENPYIVADRFLDQHDLPAEFKEQIVKFIIGNTGSGKPGASSMADLPITGGFCDPFTGGSSSSTGNTAAPARAPAATAALPTTYDITGGGVDPFTGGSSSSRGASAAAASISGQQQQVPARAYLLFDNAPPVEGLRRKVLEFNQQLAGAADLGPDALLADQEIAPGGLLDQLLGSLAGATSATAASAQPLPVDAIGIATRLLRWPAQQLFPALDIARCLVLHAAAAAQLAASAGSMSTPAIGTLSGALAAAAVSGVGPALQTGLRLVANCFKQPELRFWVLENRELLLDGFAGCCSGTGGNKGLRLSLATVLLNYAVAAGAAAGQMSIEGAMQLMSGLDELLGGLPVEEADSVHRVVLALGTLLAAGGPDLVGLAKDLGLAERLQGLSNAGGKAAVAVQEVRALLH